MKSNQNQLAHRGKLDENILKKLSELSKEELIQGFEFQSQYRTACVHIYSERYHQDDDFTQHLLNLLSQEKALYTKIEIQNQLSLYGNIQEMCQYLGCIGHNQYKDIPNHSSFKKSYPLPRDIIARSLAYIDTHRFQEFYQLLPTLSPLQFQEAIDAFGFFCFYHKDIVTSDMFKYLRDCFQIYKDNELIIWKLVTCLSAFKSSINFLESLKQTQKHPTILQEIERSLRILSSRQDVFDY